MVVDFYFYFGFVIYVFILPYPLYSFVLYSCYFFVVPYHVMATYVVFPYSSNVIPYVK